jgi:hypothetical protein
MPTIGGDRGHRPRFHFILAIAFLGRVRGASLVVPRCRLRSCRPTLACRTGGVYLGRALDECPRGVEQIRQQLSVSRKGRTAK